ncbi:MAG: isoleucine--tRNA ligase [Nanoarchaeota archaeon]
MYNFKEVEKEVMEFWDNHNIYKKAKAKNKGKPCFYFLDGPPYTSGHVHIGTAWNKVLKDMMVRFKRMSNLDVWDRAGYDMHGLPVEHKVQAKFNLPTKEDIHKFGVSKFIEECRKFAVDNLHFMNKEFKNLGVWLDFDNAYQSITKEFIEGEWWLVKKAHENKRLYEGERSMTWCSSCATALAKHELEYEDISDQGVYVKLKLKGTDNEYLLVYTTTPWTIPFNLAVMVHPDFEYAKCKVGSEFWIVARDLAEKVIGKKFEKDFKIMKTFRGKELEGREYIPVFADVFDELKEARKTQKLFTVLLSDEYVHLEEGTGLVHTAPGCGDEDYEVGVKNGIRPFNLIDDKGQFPKNHKLFSGLTAKKDDKKFIELIEGRGALVCKEKINHSYAHCWRCKSPIVYKTTKQWFFRVEDLKPKMIKANSKIRWEPQAAFNAFNSWLENLRDNSISKQRFWGTPLPIWRNTDNPLDYIVIGSADELEKLSGKRVDDLHIPTVDKIEIKKGSKIYRRVPDVLDVWVDAGTVSWNCLDYPRKKEYFDKLFPADFILEGKDQIRGWFNLLMVASMVALGEPPFKSVYMHGFVQDAQGRKMSKSLGNYILPEEIIEKYGADTLRYYMIGGANPGVDINYNFSDVEVKHRNLGVLFNVCNYLIGYSDRLYKLDLKNLDLEEKFMLSKLNSAVKDVTFAFNNLKLNEVPLLIENLFLTLSRDYIQIIRDKINDGKEKVLPVIYTTMMETLKMFSTVSPFISECLYQKLKVKFNLKEESISFYDWPEADRKLIDNDLEERFQITQKIIQNILSLRAEKQIGVRWPLSEATVDIGDLSLVKGFEEIIKVQANIKELKVKKGNFQVKLNTEITKELEEEGFFREITRRIQALRKKAGLKREDRIELILNSSYSLKKFEKEFRDKVGAVDIKFSVPKERHMIYSKEKIKDQEFEVAFDKV